MDTFKTTAKIAKNGTITLHHLPFEEGVEVEITVQVCAARLELDPNDLSRPALHNPLKGTVIWHIYPFEPAIPEEEWEMLANDNPFRSADPERESSEG